MTDKRQQVHRAVQPTEVATPNATTSSVRHAKPGYAQGGGSLCRPAPQAKAFRSRQAEAGNFALARRGPAAEAENFALARRGPSSSSSTGCSNCSSCTSRRTPCHWITVTCARTAAPLKSALRTAQTSQAGHVTFSDDVILIEVESLKDEHLWWNPEELSDAPRSKGKKAIDKPAVADLGGPSASRPNGTKKTNLAANPLSQSGATSQNGREALSQRGDGVDGDVLQPKWHGGTLTPPPPMVEQDMDDVHGKVSAMSTGDGVRPRPHQRDKAASESKLHQKLELKCKELSRLDGTARTTPKQVAAVQTPAPSSERVMSAAEERMRNLRERIRVKEGALEAKGR